MKITSCKRGNSPRTSRRDNISSPLPSAPTLLQKVRSSSQGGVIKAALQKENLPTSSCNKEPAPMIPDSQTFHQSTTSYQDLRMTASPTQRNASQRSWHHHFILEAVHEGQGDREGRPYNTR